MTLAQRMRVLLVDDDLAGAELTLEALRALDPTLAVNLAADGEEALDFLFRRGAFEGATPEPPHVVLLDLKMPKVDGHEVLRQIREHEPLRATKVVVLTSSDQQSDRDLSRELGSDHYVVKPVGVDALTQKLRACSGLWPARDGATG